MDRPHIPTLPPGSTANVVDAEDLRSVISMALAVTPTGKATSDFRSLVRAPLATPAQLADEPAAFPSTSDATPRETGFPDWRSRLTRNLSRRGDGRWEPLTHVDAVSA
jgi:hypothetical protein